MDPTERARPQAARRAANEAAAAPTPDQEPLVPGTISLQSAIELALSRRPELRAATEEVAALWAETRVAGYRPVPTMGIEAEDFAGSGDLSGYDGAQTTLWLSKTFERGGKRDARRRAAGVELNLARLDIDLLEREIQAQVTGAFHRALSAKAVLDLVVAAEQDARETSNAVRERASAGRASPVEATKYEVALAEGELRRRAAERDWREAQMELARACGTPATDSGSWIEGLDAAPRPVTPPPPLAELQEALAHGPRMRRVELERDRAAAAVASARAARSADVALSVGMRRFEESDDTAALLSVELPLQAIRSSKEQEAAARARQAGVEHTVEATRSALRIELARTREAMSSAFDEITRLEGGLLDDARRVLQSTSTGYRAGRFELIDVLDAQRTDRELRIRHARALAEYHLATARMTALVATPRPPIESARTIDR